MDKSHNFEYNENNGVSEMKKELLLRPPFLVIPFPTPLPDSPQIANINPIEY
jgi:hypothetical protein